MRVFLSFLSASCLIWALLVPSLSRASELELQALRLEPESSGAEVLEIDLNAPGKSAAFTLPNPPRLAIDLPTFRWVAPKDGLQQYHGRLIGQLRYARNTEDKSRIVLQLNAPVRVERLSPVTSNHLRLRLIPLAPLPAPATPPIQAATPPREARLPAMQRDHSPHTPMENTLNHPNARPELQSTSSWAPVPVARPAAKAAPQTARVETSPSAEPPQTVAPRPMIVIDAGHGGQDPGASGVNGAQEKFITLAYAKELKQELEATGRYRVTLTRDRDFFIPLRGRVDIARKAHGNMFISIHADSAPGAEARGLSMYTLSNTASDAESAKLAARENKADIINGVDLSGASKDVTDILIELAQRNSMARSGNFAQNLIGGMRSSSVNMITQPHRTAGFAVLKAPDMPSALIEIGFLSHPQEEQALQTEAMRERIAGAIVKGIDSYFARTTTADNQ